MRFYKLKDWIDEDKLYWYNCNCELLKQRPRELIGEFIGKRQLYRDWFVEANPEKLTGNLSFNSNTEAVELLKQNR
jgi:hypothetical protein